MLACWKFYVNFPLLHNLMSRNKTFLILSRISHRSFDLKLDTREKSFICVCFDYDKVLVTMFTEIYFRFYCPPCSNCDGMWNAKRVQVYCTFTSIELVFTWNTGEEEGRNLRTMTTPRSATAWPSPTPCSGRRRPGACPGGGAACRPAWTASS